MSQLDDIDSEYRQQLRIRGTVAGCVAAVAERRTHSSSLLRSDADLITGVRLAIAEVIGFVGLPFVQRKQTEGGQISNAISITREATAIVRHNINGPDLPEGNLLALHQGGLAVSGLFEKRHCMRLVANGFYLGCNHRNDRTF